MNSRILVTGGAGFIGSNLVSRLVSEGHDVVIFDNLSRAGGESNLAWLRKSHGENAFQLEVASLTDFDALRRAAEGVDRIYHLAGQVAVTTSVLNPRLDFEDNALGTFNMLEAARTVGNDPIVIYASTNKVYGGLGSAEIVENKTRYSCPSLRYGVSESQPLDFHSPYGCSKGAGDQYTRDYYRVFGLKTVVVRQSCIYGYRQLGIEDQGWIAWFIIAALKRRPIAIYGDGKQVRDVLFINDLLDAYDAVIQNIETSAGRVYNIGGGPENTISIWSEFSILLQELLGYPVPVEYLNWRPGDQRVYVSDIRKADRELGWRPQTPVREGISQLFDWIQQNQALFQHLYAKQQGEK